MTAETIHLAYEFTSAILFFEGRNLSFNFFLSAAQKAS